MKKSLILSLMLGLMPIGLQAQNGNMPPYTETSTKKAFSRLDLSLTTGTTGVGLELSAPINELATLRAGFSYMPKFKPVMTFSVEGRGQNGEITHFGSLADKLQQFIGYEVDEQIDMVGEPSFYNFNVLVDFHPFKNKNWHLTAGVYIGPNEIANAYNKTEEMPSLLALGMYNKMYEKVSNFEPVFGDVYFDPDEVYGKMMMDMGRMGIYVGEFDDGTPYMMEPNVNAMVKVRMRTASFIRPYLGFGYGGRLIKGDDRYHVSFDCGAMFWGGRPEVLTHDGVDLVRHLHNIRGQVDDYVKVVDKMSVYPVLNFKISYQLF